MSSSAWREQSSLEQLDRRRRPGAQHRQIARYRQKFHAALGKRHGAFGGMTIGAGDFLHALRRGDEGLEFALNIFRQWIDGLAVRQRDRQIRRAEEETVDTGRGNDRLEIL